jgi:hypothetical protein
MAGSHFCFLKIKLSKRFSVLFPEPFQPLDVMLWDKNTFPPEQAEIPGAFSSPKALDHNYYNFRILF